METISKTMLVEQVAEYLDDSELSLPKIEAVVNATIAKVIENVAAGDKGTFQNFGSWEPRERKAHTARNPKTSEPIQVPAKVVPVFSAGKGFKKAVAPN